jgi:hypothetical protein
MDASLQQPARVLALLGLVGIVVLSVVPGNLRPHTALFPMAEHFVAYAGVAGALAVAAPQRQALPLIIFALAILSGGLELVQAFIPGRSCDLFGFGGSSLGAIAGALTVRGAMGFMPSLFSRRHI